ncbi:MAG: type II toxin-antitoxin system ParD family antitoxin [Sulfurisoma sp.]|nr:type II toxin-antitoxin system ParD family antitoxin [Sulfurisoma sp.]
MPTRNVVLTHHQASFVEQLVSIGRYQNASEVLRERLRLIEQREAEDAARLEALRNAIRVGIDDFEAGRFTTFESSEALGTHLKSVAAKAIAGGDHIIDVLRLLHDSMELTRHISATNDQPL